MRLPKYLYRTSLTIVIVLLPYITGFSPNPGDSSATTFSVAVGQGSFAEVSRDSSGNILNITDVLMTDVGAAVKSTYSVGQAGVKAGILSYGPLRSDYSGRTGATANGAVMHYVTPSIGLNTQFFEFNLGGLIADYEGAVLMFRKRLADGHDRDQKVFPSGSLRIGNRDGYYFSTSYLDNLPLVNGGGMYDIDLGFHSHTKRNGFFWLGIGALPYDGCVFSFKSAVPLSENLAIDLHGAFSPGAVTEYGFSVGTTFSVH